MLKHIDVHYLAAILTQIASPWGVEIELGELIEDIAAEKNRDVDITVHYQLKNGTLAELHGIEVKNEGRSLDVVHVEQIIAKLTDMPSLTKRALISSHGFTEPAKKKALHHGLDLYHLQDWDGAGLPVDMSQTIFGGVNNFEWVDVQAIPIVESSVQGSSDQQETFKFGADLLIYDPSNPNLKCGFGELLDSVCGHVLNNISAEVSNDLTFADKQRFAVSKLVNFETPFQIPVNGRMLTIIAIKVEGIALLKKYPAEYAFKALIRDGDSSPIAGCMINELSDGSLSILMTNSKEGSLTARFISVLDRGKKKIYKEKMKSIPKEGPPLLEHYS